MQGDGHSFGKRYIGDKKKSNHSQQSSNLTRRYLFKKPIKAEEDGYDGLFNDLVLLTGIGLDPTRDNSCLTRRKNGAFVWSDRTMTKNSSSRKLGNRSKTGNSNWSATCSS